MEDITYRTVSYIMRKREDMNHRGGSIYDQEVPVGCRVISVFNENQKPLVFSQNVKEGILSVVDWNQKWQSVQINIE